MPKPSHVEAKLPQACAKVAGEPAEREHVPPYQNGVRIAKIGNGGVYEFDDRSIMEFDRIRRERDFRVTTADYMEFTGRVPAIESSAARLSVIVVVAAPVSMTASTSPDINRLAEHTVTGATRPWSSM